MTRSKILLTSMLFVAVGLSGCANWSHQEKGTAAGAVVGGVAGNLLCGGVLCTGAGAAVGGVLGHEISKPKK